MSISSLECRALLFDLDGVLVDSHACTELIWRTWAHRHGLDPTVILRVAPGRRTFDTLREVAPHLDPLAEAAVLNQMELEERRGTAPVKGAAELLASLPPRQWAVVTSGALEVARLRLGLAGLPDPPFLVSASDVQHGKPDPEGYLMAAHALGVAPKQCVVLEDAPAGVAAGKAAGMSVLAVLSTHGVAALCAADHCLHELADLRARMSGSNRIQLSWSAT